MLDTVKNRYRSKETEVHPHSWTLPDISKPSRRLKTRSSDSLPSVPPNTIYRDVAIPYSLTRNSTAPPTFEQYPSPGHVAAHLLLIECVHELRSSLERTDDDDNASDQAILESSWSTYLQTAIKRFKLWITRIESVLRHSATFNRYGTGSHLHGAFTVNYLPPLDVLIVWYCYLQNPPAYERLIASNDFRMLSQICFPWHTLTEAIDSNTLQYRVSSAAETLWRNLVSVPFDQASFSRTSTRNDELAFTSSSSELCELVTRQTNLMEDMYYYQWLRSPALEGTIKRGMARYTNQIKSLQISMPEQTQQVPVGDFEKHNIDELDLDIVCQLVLNTHRAFHSAWKCFTQQYNIDDEDVLPPPSYEDVQEQKGIPRSDRNARKSSADTETTAVEDCYCWICERIKDERDEPKIIEIMPALTQVTSPEELEEKKSIKSDSSDDSNESTFDLDLNRGQIKQIKRDIRLFRHVEALRQRKLRKDSG